MSIKNKIIAATPMISLIVFLVLGCVFDKWHPGWIVFFAIPIVPVLLNVTGFKGLYPICVVIAYLVMGFIWDLWHPGWIIYLTIPVVDIFIPSGKKIKEKDSPNGREYIFTYDSTEDEEDK